MTFRNFVPELWSDQLLMELHKTLIYAGPGIINRDYEGQIQRAGDTVRITSIGRPSVGKYVPGKTKIVPEPLHTTQRTMTVDQARFWSFEADDVDAKQAGKDFLPEASAEAAYALGDDIDQWIAGLHTEIPEAQRQAYVEVKHGLATADAQDFEYRRIYDDLLVPMKVKLDAMNVPKNGRYVIITPWMNGDLIRDARFIENDKSADPSTLRNGQVGRAAGFDILSSNNVPEITVGDGNGGSVTGHVVQAGTSRAITYADQLIEVEAFRPHDGFSDAIKGLCVFGGKLIRPDSIVCGTAVSTQA